MTKGRVILERRFVPEGTVVIKQGDPAYSAYIIQSGEVSVYSETNGNEVELARLGIGEICGEMALINDEERTANVKATKDCNLIVITRNTFEDKLKNSDTTIQAVVRMLIARVKSSNTSILGQKGDLQSLKHSVEMIYNNAHNGMDEKTAKDFEKKVKPKMDAFFNMLGRFE